MSKKIVYFAVALLVFAACRTVYVPVKETEYVHIKDSVAVHDTTIAYQIEKEYIERYATDTLRLETNYSNFVAFQDTTVGKLSGMAWNKSKTVEVPVQWKERIVYRDSISVKEVPVEVEKPVPYVPLFWRICSVFGIAAVCLVALWLGFKFIK